MPATRDYYSILQLNPSASQAAVEAAYQRLSRLYDPDTSQKRRAIQRKEELDEAYEVLSDPRQRAQYDRMRAKGYRPGQPVPDPRESASRVGRGWATMWAWLDNPYVFAGIAGGGVMVILAAIVLISLAGGGSNEAAVLNPSPSVSANPTPSMPPQSPITPPDKPPVVDKAPVTTASGLQYIDMTPGSGASPVNGDTVAVNYTGWLQSDGTKFDSSLSRTEAFGFKLGSGQVIKGWDEGLLGMQKGGQRRLIIPADLAYGAAGRPPTIPANATLIFDIDLIEIFPAATPAPQPTSTAPANASPSP